MNSLIKKVFSTTTILLFILILGCLSANIATADTIYKKLAVGGAGSVQNNATVGTSPAGVSSPKPVVTLPASSQTNPNSGFTLIPGAGGIYTLLAPIGTFFPGGSIDIKGGGLGGYLNGLYRAGIAIATGLALVMIVVGGLEYVSTDSIQGKSNGRERIKNAIIGLLLALTSFIILRQINPNLLKSDLNVTATQSTGTVGGSAIDLVNRPPVDSLAAYPLTQQLVNSGMQGVPGYVVGGGTTVGGGVLTSSGMGMRIVQAAKNNINTSTCLLVTENGNKGCGYAFGKIMSDAGISFTNLNSTTVLSTSQIYSALSSDRRFYIVTSDIPSLGRMANMSLTLPGDIIISPTTPLATGHVGIIEFAQASRIISNSSGSASIQSNYTGTTWLNRFRTKLNINTHVFRYK